MQKLAELNLVRRYLICGVVFNFSATIGPYFPKRGEKVQQHKGIMRQGRPQFYMFLQSNMLECTHVRMLNSDNFTRVHFLQLLL